MAIDRRDFLKLMGLGSAVLVLGSRGLADAVSAGAGADEFFFVQLSDIHWGFNDPKINADYQGTLKKAIDAVNSMSSQPDFVVFTGDLSHITDDADERRRRLTEVRDMIKGLKVSNVKFLPGEHDAVPDRGSVYQEIFGKTHYTFEHKGVNFIVLDNVSDAAGIVGDEQLKWLSEELKKIPQEARIVVFTHRPLYPLYPQWNWTTHDGNKVLDILMPYKNVTVFHGHIHQEHHQKSGHIEHNSDRSLMWAFPAAGSVPHKKMLPWDPAEPYKGLGYRGIKVNPAKPEYVMTEYKMEKIVPKKSAA